MNKWRRASEWIINILTILVAAILVKTAISRYLPSGSATVATVDTFKAGSSFDLDNVDWASNGSTLVMALQTGCRWCEASMDLYGDILRSNTNNSFHVVALFPQPVPEAKVFLNQYLHQLSDNLADVRQVSFGKVGISATPTLILLDKHGRVQSSWVGELSSKQERDIFNALKIRQLPVSSSNSAAPSASAIRNRNESLNFITPTQFATLLSRTPSLPVIDIDPRPIFKSGHIVGALNIPIDEIYDRAVHEVPIDMTIVIYCDYCPPCESSEYSQGVQDTCTEANSFLRQQGFSHTKMLAADLNQLARAGIHVTGAGNRN